MMEHTELMKLSIKEQRTNWEDQELEPRDMQQTHQLHTMTLNIIGRHCTKRIQEVLPDA